MWKTTSATQNTDSRPNERLIKPFQCVCVCLTEREWKKGTGFKWSNTFCELINNPVGYQFVWVDSPVCPSCVSTDWLPKIEDTWVSLLTWFLRRRSSWREGIALNQKGFFFVCMFVSDFDSFQALLSNVTPWPSLCPVIAPCFVTHHYNMNSSLLFFFAPAFSFLWRADRFRTVME